MSDEPTKKTSEEATDDLRPEYDFRSLRVVARGPGRRPPHGVTVELAPDVSEAFPDAESVNEALRLLIKAAMAARRPKSALR